MLEERVTKNLGICLVEGVAWLACFVMIVVMLAPTLITQLNHSHLRRDQSQAEQMTDMLQSLDMDAEDTFDAHEIRILLERNSSETLSFTPQSRNSAFFYHVLSNRVLVMDFESALTFVDEASMAPTSFASPSELFGEGLLLLSTEGSDIAIEINQIYFRTGRSLQPTSRLSEQLKIATNHFEAIICRLLLNESRSVALNERLNALAEYYTPHRTLFVNNHHWFTMAESGQDIHHILFQPGMSHVPRFDLAKITKDSIVLDEVTLPRSIRSISSGAFGDSFSIDRINLMGEADVRVEKSAFSGVRQVMWNPSLYVRDDPIFEVDAWFENRPLITYDIETIRETLTLDLSHVKRYFSSLDMTIVSYNVALDLSDMSQTKVYIYTIDGYFGYVIPVARE